MSPTSTLHAPDGTGTDLLYLRDPAMLEAKARIVESTNGVIVPDRTPLYAKRGGQPSDTGSIVGNGFRYTVTQVVLDRDGWAHHTGDLEGETPRPGQDVRIAVDPQVRHQHSTWHTAGEALIVAAKMAGFDEPVTGAIHYGPHQNRIDYRVQISREGAEQLASRIEANLTRLIADDVRIQIIETAERRTVVDLCGFSPDYLEDGQKVRIVQIHPDHTGRPCTGTHLSRTSELPQVKIDRVRVKADRLTISYSCAD